MNETDEQKIDHLADKVREQMHHNTDDLGEMGNFLHQLVEDIPALKRLKLGPENQLMMDVHIMSLESVRDAIHRFVRRVQDPIV